MTRDELSALLLQEMQTRGWSVMDLSRASGVTYEVVRRVVRGQSSSSVEHTNEILVAVGYELRAMPIPPKDITGGGPGASSGEQELRA